MLKGLAVSSIAIAAAIPMYFAGTGANAQPSACFQTCRIEYNWPAQQCARYCQAKARETRVYGFTQRRGARAGGCGTYMYWDGSKCTDARNK